MVKKWIEIIYRHDMDHCVSKIVIDAALSNDEIMRIADEKCPENYHIDNVKIIMAWESDIEKA